MKVEKLVKDLFKNHSVLAVVLGAVVLVYFIDNYSKGKGTFGMTSSSGSFETPAGFSDQGGSLGDVPNVVFPSAALCDATTWLIAIYY